MSQYILDCETRTDTCTMVPYTPPPATVDHYALGPEWGLLLGAALILALIVATSVVRYKLHGERADTERKRILNPPLRCPTCGDKVT